MMCFVVKEGGWISDRYVITTVVTSRRDPVCFRAISAHFGLVRWVRPSSASHSQHGIPGGMMSTEWTIRITMSRDSSP